MERRRSRIRDRLGLPNIFCKAIPVSSQENDCLVIIRDEIRFNENRVADENIGTLREIFHGYIMCVMENILKFR